MNARGMASAVRIVGYQVSPRYTVQRRKHDGVSRAHRETVMTCETYLDYGTGLFSVDADQPCITGRFPMSYHAQHVPLLSLTRLAGAGRWRNRVRAWALLVISVQPCVLSQWLPLLLRLS